MPHIQRTMLPVELDASLHTDEPDEDGPVLELAFADGVETWSILLSEQATGALNAKLNELVTGPAE